MALKRILALLLAAGLISGALVVRGGRVPASDADPPVAVPKPGGGEGLTLTCAAVLAEVCGQLVVELADEGIAPTLTVAGPPPEGAPPVSPRPGALVTLAPLPELLGGASPGGADSDLGPARLLARSPLVVAVWDDRAEVLAAACGAVLDWRCIGELARPPGTWAAAGGPESWGPVKPGHADPTTSEVGQLMLGQLAAAWFDRSEVTSRDLDDLGFFGWFSELEAAVPTFQPSSGSPLLAMVQFGPSAFDVVGVAEAEAVGLLARSAGRAATLRLRPVEPIVTADAVVTPVGGSAAVDELVGAIARRAPELLSAAGWRVEGRPAQGALADAGVDRVTLPAATGLPSAGTLAALRRTWSEVTR